MLTNPQFITLADMSPLNSRLIYPSSYSAQFIWMSTMHLKINISKMTPDSSHPSTKSTLPQYFPSSRCSDKKLERHSWFFLSLTSLMQSIWFFLQNISRVWPVLITYPYHSDPHDHHLSLLDRCNGIIAGLLFPPLPSSISSTEELEWYYFLF